MSDVAQMEAVARQVARGGARLDIAVVASVVGTSARLYLDGSTAAASEAVPCLAHYTPAAGHRVLVAFQAGRPLAVLGKF